MLKTETVNGSWTLFECVGQLFGHGPEELVEAIRKGLQTQWLMLKKLRRSETISELTEIAQARTLLGIHLEALCRVKNVQVMFIDLKKKNLVFGNTGPLYEILRNGESFTYISGARRTWVSCFAELQNLSVIEEPSENFVNSPIYCIDEIMQYDLNEEWSSNSMSLLMPPLNAVAEEEIEDISKPNMNPGISHIVLSENYTTVYGANQNESPSYEL
ncbi:unnamed protein product [Dracunculus medinensis]|uniref:Protein kinase domain-containing protein n=1 Tax=Dracunculus medinensis TaxID=318479 RepID=A0A0N4UL63_DRAME|nr:unnamed protein product [Dracunculus medinensis]